MSNILYTSGFPPEFGSAGLGGRNYDYTKLYGPGKKGDEVEENARVWNVYLDEAESYDADMIQRFRNIIDSLLVFASLFSAVVTTFVAQTSQALQPDSTQIMVSLLVESNSLLRAAGNGTNLNAIPEAVLQPGSRTYTQIDVWVNILFFTSLSLSLSTALLSVLTKQWIQAYTSTMSGSAKHRALIRQFRYQGPIKWKLSGIVESLPFILHGSVAIFLAGLALYAYQLSFPICGVVCLVTFVTFLAYLGSLLLPAIFVECPYRIPSFFPVAQLLLFIFHTTKCAFLWIWSGLSLKVSNIKWPDMSHISLKTAEYNAVFPSGSDKPSRIAYWDARWLTCDTLYWMISHSSNRSVQEIVVEALSRLLTNWKDFSNAEFLPFSNKMSKILEHDLFPSTVLSSLYKLSNMPTTTTTEDPDQFAFTRLFQDIVEVSNTSLLSSPIAHKEKWKTQLHRTLTEICQEAAYKGDLILSRCLLDWGCYEILQPFSFSLLNYIASHGKPEDIHDVLDRGLAHINYLDSDGWTALHWAASGGRLDNLIVLVGREPSLAFVKSNPPNSLTALDVALQRGFHEVVMYLLSQLNSVDKAPYALHSAVYSGNPSLVKILLDRGWSRTAEDGEGRTPLDIASGLYVDEMATVLQEYELTSKQLDSTVTHTALDT